MDRPAKTVLRPHPSQRGEPADKPTGQTDKPSPFEVRKLISLPANLSEKAKTVYNNFGEEPLFADEISKNTGLAPWEVISALTELELSDLVCLCAGKRYKKI